MQPHVVVEGIELEELKRLFVFSDELRVFFEKPAGPLYITIGVPYLSRRQLPFGKGEPY